MKTRRPSVMTMAKVLFEDENPQILAWLIIDYEDNLTPISVKPPKFINNEKVRWECESIEFDHDCFVIGLRVEFLEHKFFGGNDYAINYYGLKIEKGDLFVPSYTISVNIEEEYEICNKVE